MEKREKKCTRLMKERFIDRKERKSAHTENERANH
jgi:hypothetical protein